MVVDRVGSIEAVPPACAVQMLAQPLDASRSDADGGAPTSPEWRAIYNRDEVARLSLAGTPVAQIAATLGLSTGHVVRLRARLGVGRQR